jgi:hypothetical protein
MSASVEQLEQDPQLIRIHSMQQQKSRPLPATRDFEQCDLINAMQTKFT